MTENTENTQCDVEFWVAVNEDGDFVVNTDGAQEAQEDLSASYSCQAIRVYAMHLAVTKPKVVEVAATIPDTDGPVTVTVS